VTTYISRLPTAADFPRRLVLLGSTGSIGASALKVVADHPERFSVLALAGARNAARLAEQARAFRPPLLAVLDESVAATLRSLLPAGYAPDILAGPEGYVQLATLAEADMVLAAQVGAAGLPPALAAASAGKRIALANKEALVLAGDLFRAACAASGGSILPVDSEHNALFQALAGHDGHAVRRLLLTASGGPFRGRTRQELAQVTREQALAHPNWSMGAKISIDSATLMNKGLEVIEAHHLFGLPAEAIEVVVHPQSIVHSLVEYEDRSMLAQLGPPDMRIAIAYALAYPRRLPLPLAPLDLAALGKLTFEAPDLTAFPCLGYAFAALRAGGTCPAALNAANEVAVEAFLAGRIGFSRIPDLVAEALESHENGPAHSLDAVLAADLAARELARRRLENR
jgi:1-deoxy-D-xylulose-5-phosphate reductoisomerase